MTITCIIEYEIDPYQKQEFEQYSRNWGQIIPRCGADLIGYFSPHEGSTSKAYGIYNVDNLAAYEHYRKTLANHPLGQQNYEYSQQHRFILKESRSFVKLVSTPHYQDK